MDRKKELTTAQRMKKEARKLRWKLRQERQALEGLEHTIAKMEHRLEDLTQLGPDEFSALEHDDITQLEERILLHASNTQEREREDEALAWMLHPYHPSRY